LSKYQSADIVGDYRREVFGEVGEDVEVGVGRIGREGKVPKFYSLF
jgi:hypothetical protein